MSKLSLDKPIFGIILFTFGNLSLISSNVFVKLLSDDYLPYEIVFYRCLFLLIICLTFIFSLRRTDLLKTKKPLIHLQRSILGTLAIGFVYWSYQLVPMTDATAIHMLSGLIIVILGALILKENIGFIRFIAVLAGFVGGYMILQPDITTMFHLNNVVPLIAAFILSGTAIYLRYMGRTEHPFTTIFYFCLMAWVITGTIILFTTGFHLTGKHALLFLTIIALCGGMTQFSKTYAYKFAEVSTLTPYLYLTLVWAVFFDILIWNDWPEANVWIGSAIIVVSNFIVLWREKRRKKILILQANQNG